MIGNYIGAPIGGVINTDTGNTGFLAVTLDDATGSLDIAGGVGTVLDDASLIATAHVAARVLARIGDGGYANTPAAFSGKRTMTMAGANIGRTQARGSSLTHISVGGGRL